MDKAKKTPFADEYLMKQQIGKGAFAAVFLCERKADHKQFAVKQIFKNQTPAQRDSLETEVKIMWMMRDHGNIVHLVDLFESDNSFFLVLELLTGGELFDKIVELNNYSEKDAARVTKELLLAVKHMHDRDVVHRDLKPENLLLENKSLGSHIKVADFGLSKYLKETPALLNCAGTPGYLAPEVLEAYYHKRPYGKSVDLWSTGVILYILLFGIPPFWDEDQDEMFEKIRHGEYEFPPDMPISAEAKDLIQRLLIVDPAKRLTIDQALAHPWIAHGTASDTPLPDQFREQLKKFNARRRFKGAINAVRALSKLKLTGPGLLGIAKTASKGSGVQVQSNENDVLPAWTGSTELAHGSSGSGSPATTASSTASSVPEQHDTEKK